MGQKPIRLDFSVTFQLKYCLAIMVGSVVSSLLLYLYFDQGLGESYFDSLLTLRNLEQALPSSIIITSVIQILLILVLTIAINLFVSHKIAGPVYRYEQSLGNILDGDLRVDVRTREGDQLKSMVDSLNGLQDSLRRIYTEADMLREDIGCVLELPEGQRLERLEQICSRGEALRRRLRGSVSGATEES